MPIDAEFSRPFALDSLPPGVAVALKASAEECRALAGRFDLVRLDRLEGEVGSSGRRRRHAGPRRRAPRGRRRPKLRRDAGARGRAKVQAEFDRLFSRACRRRRRARSRSTRRPSCPSRCRLGQARPRRDPGRGAVPGARSLPRAPEADRRWPSCAATAARRTPVGALASLRSPDRGSRGRRIGCSAATPATAARRGRPRRRVTRMSLTIALDGMGGDAAPGIVVEGAALALERIRTSRSFCSATAPGSSRCWRRTARCASGRAPSTTRRTRWPATPSRRLPCARAATRACGSPSMR